MRIKECCCCLIYLYLVIILFCIREKYIDRMVILKSMQIVLRMSCVVCWGLLKFVFGIMLLNLMVLSVMKQKQVDWSLFYVFYNLNNMVLFRMQLVMIIIVIVRGIVIFFLFKLLFLLLLLLFMIIGFLCICWDWLVSFCCVLKDWMLRGMILIGLLLLFFLILLGVLGGILVNLLVFMGGVVVMILDLLLFQLGFCVIGLIWIILVLFFF